jgi:broad specificity phosphatase PhoE
MKIYVIRHGQTTSDVEDRYGGDYDDHLTELGIKQASELAQKIKDFGIEAIFASPKIRAQETANILKEELRVEIKTISNLRERNQYGILSGMKKSEALKKYPEMVKSLKDRFNTIEGAEDYESFRKRVINVFDEVAKSDFKTVAVVTHGGPIRRIFGEILKMEKKWEIADCGWFVIEYQNNKASLIKTEGITSGE